MKTRAKKSITVNTPNTREKSNRKPLSDKTNNANTSNNMKRKKNDKQPTLVSNKIGTRQIKKNSVNTSIKRRQNKTKNGVASNLDKTKQIGNNSKVVPTKKNQLINRTKTNVKHNSSKLNNSLKKTVKEQKNTQNVENSISIQNTSNVTRRSSRFSVGTTNKRDSKSSNLPEKSQIKNLDNSTNKQKEHLKSDENQPKVDVKTTPFKNKRLLNCLKSPSPENSDPYEFKFDPKEEPKPKPKKRARPKKYDITSDTSDEEDNSMKPIVKKIRKKVDIKQKVRVTPFERKLRNRLVKVDKHQTPQTTIENIQSIDKPPEIADVTEIKNTSVVDEINEIANTFLEDDISDVSISSASRIDIISNLITRKSIKPSTNVFNSTMIHETPKQVFPPSPWRVEVSAIPRKPLNFSVKNKSFTPSYTPDVTDHKKQSTLLGFVNRTPKTDLQVTLFQNSPTRKPFENLSNSMSPIHPNRSNISPAKRSNDSLFGFTVLSDSEDKENSPIFNRIVNKQKLKSPEKKQTESVVKVNEPDIDISIPLFEDLIVEKRNEKRYSRQYTRPQTKRKRNVSFKVCSDDENDSECETEIHHTKKKQKDVLTKEEAEEAERLASHYNSYFEEIENYPLCIE